MANYKDDRNFLIMRYAHAWLEALHNEDPAMYASLAYDRSKVIDDRWDVVELAKGDEVRQSHSVAKLTTRLALRLQDLLSNA